MTTLHKQTITILTILLCMLFQVADASLEVKVRNLTTANGMSNNFVRAFYQDSRGFIWIASQNGLNRFDGNAFKVILPENNGRPTLAGGRIKALREDGNGFLWIVSEPDMISCYDIRRDRFADFTGCGDYRHHYRSFELVGKTVWLWGENGCRRVEYRDGKFSSEEFTKKNRKLPSDLVRRMAVDKAGRIWVITDRGLAYYSNGKMHTVDTKRQYQWAAAFGKSMFFIGCDGTISEFTGKGLRRVATVPGVKSRNSLPGEMTVAGRWIIYTTEGGYAFDPARHTVTEAQGDLNVPNGRVTSDNKGNLWVFNRTGLLRYVNANTGTVKTLRVMPEYIQKYLESERYSIVHDHRGIIWIGVEGNGLFSYDPATGNLNHYTAENRLQPIISSDFIHALFEDRSGGLWVGMAYAGVSYLQVPAMGTQYIDFDKGGNLYGNMLRMVTPSAGGDVIIGNSTGDVFEYNSSLQQLKRTSTYGFNIYDACRDNSGRTWLATKGGGIMVDGKAYTNEPDNPRSLGSNTVFCLLKDRNGRMWAGSFGGGLNLAVPDGRGGFTFRRFFCTTYGQRRIRSLCQDKNGWIWVGTSEGLIVFRPERLLKNPNDFYTYSWNNNKLRSNEIRSVKTDSRGNVWIAESRAGFCICKLAKDTDYAKLQFIHYNTKDGLVNNMVQSFVEDRYGRMWISTEYGISCFIPETKAFRNFFLSNELTKNVYAENSALRLADGRLAFGTNAGLAIVNPSKKEVGQETTTVTFTDITVNGEKVSAADKDSPLSLALTYLDEIRLSHEQNSFVISFSTLDYAIDSHPQYRYWLENYDRQWSEPSSLSFASYKNLSPGTYYLHVKANNAYGQWEDKESVLKIVIRPPFYATIWAFLLYITAGATALFFIWKTVRRMDELRTRVKVEEQMTDYKLVFFTNISHEFRTPLTLIRGALERMHRPDSTQKERNYDLKLMDKSVSRMLRLINQLIDFRRAEKNKLSLSLEETDVRQLVRNIFDNFKETADSKNMTYTLNNEDAECRAFVDVDKVDKILYNLLSNAFKFTPTGGAVTVSLKRDEQRHLIIISVADNGVGIDKSRRGDLFTRYNTGHLVRNSMGIGLHLVHELVTVHKGVITYADNPGGGSIFTVSLPSDKGVYKAEDFLPVNSMLLKEEEKDTSSKPREDEKDEEKAPASLREDTVNATEEEPMNKRNILIIDDDTDVREFLRHGLSPYADVEAEADGTSGLEYAKTHDVDLILCDVMMPGIDGFEVTRRLKNCFSTSHIPVILLTALGEEDSHVRGFECGADAYITKPFSMKLLLTRMFKLIETREKLKQKFSNDVTVDKPLISTTEQDKAFADKLTLIVERQLENADFTVDDFAAEMSLGRTIFFRKVKGVTGYSPKEYLRIMRMKKAAELLLRPDLNVSEVAYKVGLNDPLYFSKCFKSQFGVSPSAYKKNGGARQD